MAKKKDSLKEEENAVNTPEALEDARLKRLSNPEEVTHREMIVQFSIKIPNNDGKVFNGESKTVPDMNLSLKQLLHHHTRTNGTMKIHTPMYFETEIPNFQDITDVALYKQSLETRLKDVAEFYDEEMLRIEAEKQDEAAKEEKRKQDIKDMQYGRKAREEAAKQRQNEE